MIYAWIPYVMMPALFLILLAIKPLVRRRYCAICVSVSLTWATLLLFFWFGRYSDPAILAVLIGESIVGVYYLLERKLPQDWQIFRLPFLLTATFAGTTLLRTDDAWPLIVSVLAALWIACLAVLMLRRHRSLRGLAQRLIACCKDW